MNAADLDLGQLRERQVKVLSRALNQFVILKSSPEGWQPVAPDGRLAQTASMGGDVDVHIGKKPLPAPTTDNDNGDNSNDDSNSSSGIGDVYRMTASIPLDPDVSKDTQGPFSAYLSELRDWQAVLECPGLRSMWNYYIRSCSTLEMLDAHTSITRAELRSPVPGQPKEFAHQRDMVMVETSLVDPTTVVYVSTSLPTTEDDPAYLREHAPYKRVDSALWAWCVEIVTPSIDAIPYAASAATGFGTSQQLLRATASTRAKPRVCVQVTCFLHLNLNTSWKSNNALACRAAANLIPSLVAYLRLHGAPPRIARIGPSVSVDRSEWHRPARDTPIWEVSYSVMCTPRESDGSGGNERQIRARSPNPAQLPLPPLLQRSRSSAMSVGQPIIASILDLETSSPGGRSSINSNRTSLALHGRESQALHARKVSTLTSYLSSSFQRRQGEVSSAFGTHAGGIVRDGEELSLVVTRARLGSCVLEFVVDASNWCSEGRAVDITLSLSGFASVDQLYSSIAEMQAAAPELFTESQLRLTHDDVMAMMEKKRKKTSVNSRQAHVQKQSQHKVVAELAAMQLVRCFYIASHKSSRRRFLVRILNPPTSTDMGLVTADNEHDSTDINGSTRIAGPVQDGESVDKTYRVTVVVRKGASSERSERAAGLVVNGHYAEVMPFTLDPPTYAGFPKPRTRASSNSNDDRMITRHVTPQRDSDTATPERIDPQIVIPESNLAPQIAIPESNLAPQMGSSVPEMTPDTYAGDTPDEYVVASAIETGNDDEIGGTQSAAEMSANDLQTINRTLPVDAAIGSEDTADICDIPLARLQQASRVAAANWSSLGTAAAGGITVSRTELQQRRMQPGEGGSDANGVGGVGGVAAVASKNAISGTVLRAEALIEGWTIFDVFSVISIGNGAQEQPVSGLWAASQALEQVAPNAEVHHRKTSGSWATAVRDAVVCRAWTTSGRGNGRIDISECSVDEWIGKARDLVPDTPSVVRADVGLCGWRLEKAKLPPVQVGGGDQNQALDGARDHSGDAVDDTTAVGARLRSASTTGSPALDAEFENQRRKQHAVKITHYLRYNPRGWLSPDGAAAAAAGDEMVAGFRRMGAALGLGSASSLPQQQAQQAQQPGKHDESAVFQTMLLPILKDVVCSDISRVVQHLDKHGARPTVVWSRNANVLSTDTTDGGVQVQYRMAGWGSSGSGRSHVAETLEHNEFVEIEMRIEHRVWAHGQRADGAAAQRMSPAAIEIVAEPFYETSAVACFVDPETDPHATRVRVSHHRSQLLPRVEESSDGGIFMAWPTVRLAVTRQTSGGAKQPPATQPSSLVVPAAVPLPAKNGRAPPSSSSAIAPWSVPPRVSVNSVDARVRYQRRDSTVQAFYGRCRSVVHRDVARLVRGPSRAGEPFMERLPDPVPQQPAGTIAVAATPEQNARGSDGGDGSEGGDGSHGDVSRIAIEKYTVHGSGHHRVATPNQFASVMAGVFARIRHEIELSDPQSARSRWDALQRRQQQQGPDMRGDSDARSVASLVTAIADEGWLRVSGQPGSTDAATYQRNVDGLHSEIPVTVAVDVLQGICAADAARLLEQPWMRADWDTVLFDGRRRRELEFVASSDGSGSGGVGVYHSSVHVPLLCDRRDALTVCATERAAFLPTRRRLRNWQDTHGPSLPHGPPQGCGNSAAALGDYHDPTFTLVEASVPGSQPLSTTVRANVALLAVRVEPIDAFERVSGGRQLALPSCRVIVACCVDLAGAMPLPLRRAVSARIPEQLVLQLRSRLLQPNAPLWPLLSEPSRCRRIVPRMAMAGPGGDDVAAAVHVSEQVVDGQRLAFHSTLDGTRVVHEAVVDRNRKRTASYVAVVAMPRRSPEVANARGHLCSLRKDSGDTSDSDNESPLLLLLPCLLPVVSDIVVSASCFARGFDINVTTTTSVHMSENSQPIAAEAAADSDGSSLRSGSSRRRLSRVVDQAAAIPAARWVSDDDEHCRLAVYVFALAADSSSSNGSSAGFLVRTVLLPSSHSEDGDDCDDDSYASATSAAAAAAAAAAATCTVVVQESRALASTPGTIAALEPLDKGSGMPVAWCNGQRLRVHDALPSKQSLLFVGTADGRYYDVCRECGGFACDTGGEHGGAAAVGYASDTGEIILYGGGGGALAPTEQQQQQQDADGDDHEQQQCSVPMADSQSPRVTSLSSSSAAAAVSSAIAVGQGLLGATLRQRITGVPNNRSISAGGIILPAADNEDTKTLTPISSSSLAAGIQARQRMAIARPDVEMSSHWTADISGRIPIKRVVLAVFLPVRLLVIGRRVAESSESSSARKSVLALLLVLAVGAVCVLAGMRVCELLVSVRLS